MEVLGQESQTRNDKVGYAKQDDVLPVEHVAVWKERKMRIGSGSVALEMSEVGDV